MTQQSELTTECGLWDHSAKRDGTSIFMHLLFAGKVFDEMFLFRSELSSP